MSEIVEAVAALEEQAAEARELRQTVERIETEIAGHLDELQDIGDAILNLHGDLDNQIAEHDYMAVDQSVCDLEALVNVAEVLPKIDAVLLLTALLEDGPVPALTVPLELFDTDNDATFEHPRLTQEDLDRQFQNEMAKAGQSRESAWGDHEWSDLAERDDQWAGDYRNAEQNAIQNRAHKAGLHLMKLVNHIGDDLWPTLMESIEAGRRDDAVRVLAAAVAATRDARPAYKLYEANLSVQYTANPSSLGAMGEFLSDFESWLTSQKDS